MVDSISVECVFRAHPWPWHVGRQNYRIEYPSAFLLEVASSMTEVLQGPPEIYEGRGKGRVQCISTPLENEVRQERGVWHRHHYRCWCLAATSGRCLLGREERRGTSHSRMV